MLYLYEILFYKFIYYGLFSEKTQLYPKNKKEQSSVAQALNKLFFLSMYIFNKKIFEFNTCVRIAWWQVSTSVNFHLQNK